MKKIFSIIITILVIVSTTSNVASAIDYSDLRPTYTDTSDYWRYINSSNDIDDVTNVSPYSTPSFGSIYATMDSGQTSVSVNLTAGQRYCLKIYSTNQTKYESERYYVINIS